MRSSLLELNREAALAVERHQKDPAGILRHDPRFRTRIAGIDTVNPTALDEYRARLDAYNEDAQALREGLERHGVTFLAVLPTNAWNDIAVDSDLYRFNPTDEGHVPASTSIFEDIGVRALNQLGQRSLLGMGIGGLVSGAAALFLSVSVLPFTSALAVSAAALVMGGYAVGKVTQGLYFKGSSPNPTAIAGIETRLIRQAFEKSGSELFRQIWPIEGVPEKGAINLKVSLPPAPADAQANLQAAHAAGYRLTLFAVDEAISFDEDPADAFLAHRSSHWADLSAEWKRKQEEERAERVARREALRNSLAAMTDWSDPIVVVQLESATAIIVQYGDFPVEQRVIERVLANRPIV